MHYVLKINDTKLIVHTVPFTPTRTRDENGIKTTKLAIVRTIGILV